MSNAFAVAALIAVGFLCLVFAQFYTSELLSAHSNLSDGLVAVAEAFTVAASPTLKLFSVHVLGLSVLFAVFIAHESQRKEISYKWLYILGTYFIAASFFIPLFIAMVLRSDKLTQRVHSFKGTFMFALFDVTVGVWLGSNVWNHYVLGDFWKMILPIILLSLAILFLTKGTSDLDDRINVRITYAVFAGAGIALFINSTFEAYAVYQRLQPAPYILPYLIDNFWTTTMQKFVTVDYLGILFGMVMFELFDEQAKIGFTWRLIYAVLTLVTSSGMPKLTSITYEYSRILFLSHT
eukprot:TRINITY_DN24885_c0_g1_i1.p1 TRINITY_DN24885_c0_g1~~TRINITY_DN24885_c0_g1_i1.p1  ORF type:complete len:294 (-),score=1.41 TRINITY_DN24885_c0_g1_i1:157-1038(-)